MRGELITPPFRTIGEYAHVAPLHRRFAGFHVLSKLAYSLFKDSAASQIPFDLENRSACLDIDPPAFAGWRFKVGFPEILFFQLKRRLQKQGPDIRLDGCFGALCFSVG